MHPPYVAVVGPSAPEGQRVLDAAHEAGRLLAARGCIVVTGGLGGIMDAAAEGAISGGGTTLGILPGPDRGAASEIHRIVIPTGMGEMRNALIVRTADAVLAIGGAWGTLSEIALAARTGVPVYTVDSWDLPGPEVTRCDGVADAVAQLTSGLRL